MENKSRNFCDAFDDDDLFGLYPSEAKLETLPNEITIGDVVYEYGSRCYRIKKLLPNKSGIYMIHAARNWQVDDNGENLVFVSPIRTLPDNEMANVKVLQFDKFPYTGLYNFSCPNLENIEVSNQDDDTYEYLNGCLFRYCCEKLHLCFVNNPDIEELLIPKGHSFLSLQIPWILPKLKTVSVPDDVRLIHEFQIIHSSYGLSDEYIEASDLNISVVIDNVKENVFIPNTDYVFTYSFTNKPNPAVDFVYNGLDCTIISENEVSISVPDGYKNKFFETVKHNDKEYNVTAISDYGFRRYDSLTGVWLPKHIKKIGFGAFYGCEHFGSFRFSGAMEIGDYAFYGCKELRKVLSVNADGMVNIGSHAFEGCKLSDVLIPNPIGTIKSYAFFHTKLKAITLPDKIHKIEEYAFNRLNYVTFRGEIPEMHKNAFTTTHNVYFSNNDGFSRLQEAFNEKNLRFGMQMNLDYIVVPKGYKAIRENSFCWNSNEDTPYPTKRNDKVKCIYLPDSIETIENDAFYKCDNLENVFIGNSKYDCYTGLLFAIDDNRDAEKYIWMSPLARFNSFKIYPAKAIGKHAFADTKVKDVILHEDDLFIDELALENSAICEIKLFPKTKLFDRHVFKGSPRLKKVIDQKGKIYDEALVDSYIPKLQAKKEEAYTHLVDIPEGSSDREQIMRNYFFALVEWACDNMIHGERKKNEVAEKMNAGDLFAYENDIDSLLNLDLTNPTQQVMNDFVSQCRNFHTSIFCYRDSHWTWDDITGCYSKVLENSTATARESSYKLPAIKW